MQRSRPRRISWRTGRPKVTPLLVSKKQSTITEVSGNGHRSGREWFGSFAQTASRFTGKPITFIVAVALVIIWACTGPIFNYSDTWQLVINTSTTIITFLMVFLIQNTQNRDMLAVQVKLAELIIAAQGAKNRLATAEDMTEEDLELLHQEYCSRAEATREDIERRRTAKGRK
jgi:low affinity Fe/Cu permease